MDYQDQTKTGVMIGLLPIISDWSQLEVPHMTLVYAGEVKDLPATAFNELAKDAASLAQLSRPITLKVKGPEVFGTPPDPKVDVLLLQPSTELWAMRRTLEKWNASQHPFVPHVTVGPQGSIIMNRPDYIAFDKVCVGWGNEYLTFWLKR